MPISDDILAKLKDAVGPKGYADDPEIMAGYLGDWRGWLTGAAPIVLFPASTEEVQALVRIAAEHRVPIVPQGGNTGLVGASVGDTTGEQIIVNLKRMNRILDVNADDFTLVAEAGVTLLDIEEAAAAADRLFPLGLPSEGLCQIGGNISTNAGGARVLRYGMTRELVRGLEVVLPNGQVWNGLSALRKDNAGYNLKHLFIGAEGTLGIVTRASLKLFPPPRQRRTAMIAAKGFAEVIGALSALEGDCGDLLASFEVVPSEALEMVLAHVEGARNPFDRVWPAAAVIDFWAEFAAPDIAPRVEGALGELIESGTLGDAIIAQNDTQAGDIWALRENISESERAAGASIKHDVAVPRSRLVEFRDRANAAVAKVAPAALPVAFGHAADGNLHYDVCQPNEMGAEEFAAQGPAISAAVYDVVAALDGSIAAEHGIGRFKRGDFLARKPREALALMRALKAAIDPANIMNPGVLLD